MGRFACIIHPLDLQLAGTFEPGLLHKSEPISRKLLEWAPPFQVSRVSGLRSAAGEEIVGNLILCPLLPDQLLELDEVVVVDRLVKAGRLAEQAGADVVGLEAYTAIPGKRGIEVGRRLSIPVTTGSSYTVAVAVEAIQTASELLGLDLSRAKAALVGATGTLGRVCSAILADLVGDLVLVARHAGRLQELTRALGAGSHRAHVTWSSDVPAAVQEADLVVTATSTPETIVEAESLKPGALVFDLSRPRNVSGRVAKLRKDVLVIDGGLVQTPGPINFNFYFGLPVGLVYACMAETMALALEGRYESFSIGGNITVERVREIHAIARRHGFHLAAMRSFDQPILQAQIDRVRAARERPHPVPGPSR